MTVPIWRISTLVQDLVCSFLNTYLGGILFPHPPTLFFLPSELSFAKCDAPGAQQTFNVMKQVCQYPSLANHRPLWNQFRLAVEELDLMMIMIKVINPTSLIYFLFISKSNLLTEFVQF